MMSKAVLFFVSVLCWCHTSLCSTIQDQNVSITINPPYVISKAAYNVDIECRVRRDQFQSLASIFSIVISHSDTGQTTPEVLATATGLNNLVHNISQNIVNISGTIDSNNGDSFLRVTFKNSETNLTGQYQCDVSGFDNIGIPVTYFTTLKVQEISVTDIINQMQTYSNQILNLSQQLQTLNNQLQSCVAVPTVVYITNKTCNDAMYATSVLYHGHRYCLSQSFVYSYQDGVSNCAKIGGYLVELDSHEEFQLVSDIIASKHFLARVYTGATDVDREGQWVNEHNSTLRPATEWEWGSGYPMGGTLDNCQCVYVRDGAPSLIDCNCDRSNFDTYFYVCELP